MFSNSSGRDVSGRTDPQESQGRINTSHLIDLAMRSVGQPEVLIEQAIAWTAITRPYVSGTRGFARWTGTTDKVVREISGPTGGLSENGFIWTTTRGVSSAVQEERDSMELRYSDTRTQNRSTPCNYSKPSAPGALALEEKEVLEKIKSNAVLSARIGGRAQEALVNGMKTLATLTELDRTTKSGWVLVMLDPGIDLWAEVDSDTEVRTAWEPLGRRAWSLAVLCGLQDVMLSVQDIEGLTGLSKRGVQALLARMTKANPLLVEKIRQGRSFAYAIRWADCYRRDGDRYLDACDRDEIRRARAARDRVVQEASARRGTPAGFLAYRLSTASPKRDEYLAANPLPEDADEAWRALVEAGDELALYEHLRAQEAEAGPVPSTPEALAAPSGGAAKVGTSGTPLQAQPACEVDPEVLAVMRARICA
ncbi:hypothetical protein [Streptomyces hirsutus]|uniref:hypothetical protein n=1 Tax=Streptomyces hirsutus TaxID=35620 RepID=UPI003325C5F1